jgi:hypothetical protein
MRYMPMRCTHSKVHAHERQAQEVHAQEIHAHEVHAHTYEGVFGKKSL